ncbi:MAG: hypothetical protein Q9191_005210 [Dirinaria sp. TL-2023a]
MDGDENAMSFGQIVPILLLSSTIFVSREAYEDVKIEMSEHLSEANTPINNHLLHDESTSTPVSHAGQDFEMSGALEGPDENAEHLEPPRRVDTEMGGRSQASGLEAATQFFDPQRRSTFPRSPGHQTS